MNTAALKSRDLYCSEVQLLSWIQIKISLLLEKITPRKIGIQYDPITIHFKLPTDEIQITVGEAVETQSPVLGYNASKKFAEKAAWDFLAVKRPVFDLTVINPDIIIGPMIQPVEGPKHVNETNGFAVYNFFNGNYKDVEKLTFPFYHFVSLLTMFGTQVDVWIGRRP